MKYEFAVQEMKKGDSCDYCTNDAVVSLDMQTFVEFFCRECATKLAEKLDQFLNRTPPQRMGGQ